MGHIILDGAVLGMAGVALAQERAYDWGCGWHPMWGVWGVGMLLMMFAFWAIVIVGIVLGIRLLARAGTGPRSDRALEILRQRYAQGDISSEEFEARRRDLS
jgi:putative membrane protein